MSLERSTVPSCLRNSFETVTANKKHNTRNGMLVCSVWLGFCVLILTVWIKLLKSRMEVQNKVSRSHIFSFARHFQKLDQTLGLCFQPPEKKRRKNTLSASCSSSLLDLCRVWKETETRQSNLLQRYLCPLRHHKGQLSAVRILTIPFWKVQQATGVKDGLHPSSLRSLPTSIIARKALHETVDFCMEPSAPAGLTSVALCASVNQTAQPGQKGPPGRLTLVCFDPPPPPASAAITWLCVLLDSCPLSSTSSFASHNWTSPRLQLCPSGNRSIQTSSSIPAGGKKKCTGLLCLYQSGFLAVGCTAQESGHNVRLWTLQPAATMLTKPKGLQKKRFSVAEVLDL